MQIFNDERISMLFKDYKYIGIGIYITILRELYSGKLKIKLLKNIALENEIELRVLERLINDCCSKYVTKSKGSLLNRDAEYIWSENLLRGIERRKKLKEVNRQNGEKGGRPKYQSFENVTDKVNITEEQRKKLIQRYGEKAINKSFDILHEYLKRKKYLKAKSHYWLFRKDGWLINTAIRELQQDSK